METVKLTAEDIARVKGLGCLQDKRYADIFNVRVITRNGHLTSHELRAVADAADRFGSGSAAMTSRQTVEIQGVKSENIGPMMDFLKTYGLETGGTGTKVRPIVACKGTTCRFGLCDTYGLSRKIHERFYVGWHGVDLPHKVKIAVGGCPNNCVKPDLNDIGIIGQRYPTVDTDKCRGCKKCRVEAACPIGHAKVVDGKMLIDPNVCNHCGRCKDQCLFDAISYQDGLKICIGGRWGKKTASSTPLNHVFTSEEEVLDMVEKIICLFRDEGVKGERFADTISRLGFENVEARLLNK